MRCLFLAAIVALSFSVESNAQFVGPGPWEDGLDEPSKQWKAPEWTKEDYEAEGRYWDKQREILHRLDKEVRIFDGREILVPKGSPEPDAWWAEHTKGDPDRKSWGRPKKSKPRRVDSIEPTPKPSPRKPTRIIIIDPDGTVTILGF